jgi:hypothetical protein
MKKTTGLMISKELTVPISRLYFIERQKDGKYQVGIVGTTDYITWKIISEQAYQEMLENIQHTTKHKEEINRLKKRIETLERHISLMPGGTEYLMVEQDFEQKAEEQKNQ